MKKVIIAPRQMHKDILNFCRKDEIFCDVKLMSKNDLISDFFGCASSDSLALLMKEFDISYEKAKEIFPYLFLLNDSLDCSKKSEINQYYNFLLIKNKIKNNPYLEQAFKDKKVEIIGYNVNDRLLIYILNALNLEYSFIEYGHQSLEHKDVVRFNYVDEEVLFLLNSIAKLIFEDGVSFENIYVYGVDSFYSYYIEKYCDDFGLKFNGLTKESLYSNGLTIAFLNLFNETKSVDEALNRLHSLVLEDANLDAFTSIIKKYTYDYLNFQQQLEIFINELKNHYIEPAKYQPAINVINGPIFKENAHIFVVDFTAGKAPKVFKDGEYLSDLDKKDTLIENSEEKTQNSRNELLLFLRSNNYFHFSFSKIKNNEVTNESPFIQEFAMSLKNPPIITKYFSKKFLDIDYVKSMDKFHTFNEVTPELNGLSPLSEISYRTYDNVFIPFSKMEDSEKLFLSFSKLDTFNKCPFKYYVEKVLELSEFEDRFENTLGNIAHGIFENQYNKDFDFEKQFEIELAKAEEKYHFTPSETILLINLKSQLKLASDNCLLHKKEYMENPQFILEHDFLYEFDKNNYLKGRIDKIVTLSNKYYYVVDYKTNGFKFSDTYLEYGEDAQLVYYALLCSESEEVGHLMFSGFYINNVIETSTVTESEDICPKYLKLNGLTIDNMDSISMMDKSIVNGNKTLFINGISINKNNEFGSRSSLFSFDQLDEYITIAKQVLKNAFEKIRNNLFEIHPLYHDENDNACSHCEHRDLCFRKYEQLNIVKKVKE